MSRTLLPLRWQAVWLALVFILNGGSLSGQSAAPTGATLSRVLRVCLDPQWCGSMFALSVNGREYWVTAKHMVTRVEHPPFGPVKQRSYTLQYLNPISAKLEKADFTVLDTGDDGIDEVVLAPSKPIWANSLPNVKTNSVQVMLGGECEFLGYPFGEAWPALFEGGKVQLLPFIKHCTISAMMTNPHVWVLDGINNHGFSGGPVIYNTGSNQQIFAVVAGFRGEPTDVLLPNPLPTPSTPPPAKPPEKPSGYVNLNSGFFYAFDIKYAMDAIEKNPIGPLYP